MKVYKFDRSLPERTAHDRAIEAFRRDTGNLGRVVASHATFDHGKVFTAVWVEPYTPGR